MKNLIVCCDGTGNEVSENISNVLKLYRVLRKTGKTTPQQIVFYDPGLGTLALPNPWAKFKQDAIANFGLATGYGLDDKVLACYKFLINHYDDGDAIYLFGFSRGAHTVRVLAGLIHKVGVLLPQQSNLAAAALASYKLTPETADQPNADPASRDPASITQASVDQTSLHQPDSTATLDEDSDLAGPKTQEDRAAQFARIVSTRWPTIAFLGVWDTVASVIAPRPEKFYTLSLQTLPYTQRNPSVKVFRQACSIDERRRMFRLEPWLAGQSVMRNRFSATNNSQPQDSLQVWFAGTHGDIGGGYPEKESALSKYPLLWMIDEAEKCGLAVNRAAVNELAWGEQRKGSPFSYVAPDVTGPLHDSMNAAWRMLEWLPKSDTYKEWPERRSLLGHYIPDCEPRPIALDSFVHESVARRMQAMPDYRPVNLPPHTQTIPMPVNPTKASPA